MLTAEASDECIVGLAGFGEGVVARVEVFAFFELVLEEVFLVGKLAVEAEELLLFFGEGLDNRGGQLENDEGEGAIDRCSHRFSMLHIRSRPLCSSGVGSSLLLVRSLEVLNCW